MTTESTGSAQNGRAQVLQLIDFLVDYDAQRNKPVRNIADYRLFSIDEESLPVHEAISVCAAETEWLGIDFVDLPKPPVIPEDLRQYFADMSSISATRRPTISLTLPDFVESGDLDLDDDALTAAAQADRLAQLEFYEVTTSACELWIENFWLPWATDHHQAARVKSLHRDVFEQRERLSLDRESFEIVWGFGRARWSTNGYIVDHPLVTVPVEISLDPETQRLSVVPGGQAEVEIRYLAGLDIHDRSSITSARQTAVEIDLDPWDSEETSDLLLRLTRAIDDNGTVVSVASSAKSNLEVDSSWNLFVRPRVPDSQGFLNEMREIYLEDGVIPEPLRDIVALASDSQPSSAVSDGHTNSPQAEPLLLPLATNEEQQRILILAQKHAGVTVQGPPGTGKSHTIANLISHYVAYGQRVLVVAEKEQALKVLADKVPSGIRDLTVSVLGADEESRKSLEKSVTTIQSRVGTMDTPQVDNVIARLRSDLESASRGIASTMTEMLRARQAEVDVAPGTWLSGEQITPQIAAEWVRENTDELSTVPDILELTAKIPFSESSYSQYLELLKSVGLNIGEQALKELPPISELPTAPELAEIFKAIAEGDERAAKTASIFEDWSEFTRASQDEIRQTHSVAAVHAQALSSVQSSEYAALSGRMVDPLLREELSAYHTSLVQLREQAIAHRRALMASTVELAQPATAESWGLLMQAHEKLASGSRLGLFDRHHKKTLSGYTVDGRQPQSPAETLLCIEAARLSLVRQNIVRLFVNQSPIGRSIVLSERPEDDVATEIQQLAVIFELPGKQEFLANRLAQIGIRNARIASAQEAEQIAFGISEAMFHFEAEEARVSIQTLGKWLNDGASRLQASPLWSQLLEALQDVDGSTWALLRAEVVQLNSLADPAARLKELHDAAMAVAPRWAAALASAPDEAIAPERIVGAWQWRQLDSWVTATTEQTSPAVLQSQLDELGRHRRRVVAELVEVLAWRRLKDNLGPKQHLALQSYLKAVTRYGKTGGKYAQRWIREMREALNESKDAVPVWIMTTSRALSSFRPSEIPPFDVLIVDEASQIGFEALPLLSLAKKAIVVGDDKQTSPEHVGLDRQKVFDIMDDHLQGVPKYRTLFDPDNSLYDLATQKFATPVMLSEHFRSLPEIIAFSNIQAYNRRIVPLRDQPPSPGWAPLGVLRVMDGYREGDINEPEALQVANLIAQMCADENYANMTFGVVTLLGSSQAKLIWDKLYDQLGPEQLEERKIRCGEAANFQGDERDVIVISTVVAPDPNSPSTRYGAMSSVKDLRKINVAASRARNQMWVVTSVDPDMLPNGDYRAALIRHCSSFTAEAPNQDEIIAACESEFERRVVNQLLARGYAGVEVQKVVGRYRLDIVVTGPERRLAIECDGDRWHGPDVWYQDRSRQEVLERAGWTFERIRGSAYFRDPEAAMKPVWDHLEALGIPTGAEWIQGPAISTVREVSVADLPGADHGLIDSSDDGQEIDGAENDSGIDWDGFLESLDETTAPGITEAFVSGEIEDTQAEPPSASVLTLDVLSDDVVEPSDDVTQLFPLDDVESPSDEYVSLSPYKQWPLSPKPQVLEQNIGHIQAGLVEILEHEGPMIARQAHLRYQQATGGQRIGKALQRIFNVATTRAIRAGAIARLNDGVIGVVGATLYVPGTEPVVPRQLGGRTLFDVPQSELLAIMELLSAQGVEEWDIDRELLSVLGLKRMTQRTQDYLEECRSYSWKVS